MASKTVMVQEAQTHLSELLALVEQGEEVLIARDNEPVAKLVSLPRQKKRVFGQHRGKVWVSDDYDAPLPDDFWLGSGGT